MQSFYISNCMGGVLISVLASSSVDLEFKHLSVQTKDLYKIDICCFSAEYAPLRSENKDRLAQNQNNVSEWSEMSTHRLLSHWTSTIKMLHLVFVVFKVDIIITSLKCNLFSPYYGWKITHLAELGLNNNHSLSHFVHFSFQL